MATDGDTYRAYTLNVAGFALMSTFGKIVLEFPALKLNNLGLQFFIFLIIALFLFFLDIIFISRGYEIIEGKK